MPFTQNIDGLDLQLDLSEDKVVNVHGALGKISCEFCQTKCRKEDFLNSLNMQVKDIYNPSNGPSKSTPILCSSCNNRPGLKPSTILYGRHLPGIVFQSMDTYLPNCNLLFVMGTSLTVYPAAGIPDWVGENCKRVLVDKEYCEAFEDQKMSDYFLQGTCDERVLEVIEAAGWMNDIENYKDRMCENSQALLENWQKM